MQSQPGAALGKATDQYRCLAGRHLDHLFAFHQSGEGHIVQSCFLFVSFFSPRKKRPPFAKEAREERGSLGQERVGNQAVNARAQAIAMRV